MARRVIYLEGPRDINPFYAFYIVHKELTERSIPVSDVIFAVDDSNLGMASVPYLFIDIFGDDIARAAIFPREWEGKILFTPSGEYEALNGVREKLLSAYIDELWYIGSRPRHLPNVQMIEL